MASSDIYDFDETGFTIGLIAAAKVVTRSDMPGKPFLLQPGNWEAWYEDNEAPSNWRIEVSPNGWTSNVISLRWLHNHFIPLTAG